MLHTYEITDQVSVHVEDGLPTGAGMCLGECWSVCKKPVCVCVCVCVKNAVGLVCVHLIRMQLSERVCM